MEDKRTVIKMLPIGGNKQKFLVWHSKFEAVYTNKRCEGALEANLESILSANDDEVSNISTDKEKAFKR